MELSATAKAILGMIAARPRSGYEIKQLVDGSTRFFWAASYGQIYPELSRLSDAGLISGADASQGSRRRTVYKLTAKGKRALRDWIGQSSQVYELRDEGLLRLFFAGVLDPDQAADVARNRAAHAAASAAELRRIEKQKEEERSNGAGPAYAVDEPSSTVLRYGIELNEWTARWFERAAEDLAKPANKKTARKTRSR